MLSLHAVSSAGQAASYYKTVNDYYAPGDPEAAQSENEEEVDKEDVERDNGEHIRSAFYGKGAEKLGLGEFSKERFSELLHGRIDQNTQLGRVANGGEIQHRPGWDATFSAPKSVSIMGLVAGDERVIDAHHKAVEAAIDYLQKHNTFTRDSQGNWEKTDNLTVASFTHAASRNLDPQLHTHNLILNMTQDNSGKWKSLEPKDIYRVQKLAGAVYRSHLAHELSANLGYKIVPQENGSFEIDGVSKDLIKQLSSRRAEIEAVAAEKGYEDAKGKEQAALMTRTSKKEASKKSLNERWKEQSRDFEKELVNLVPEAKEPGQAAEKGDQIQPGASKRTNDRAGRSASAGAIPLAAIDDVKLAVKHLTTYEAVITREGITDFLLANIRGEYTPDHIHLAINNMIADKQLLPSLVTTEQYKEGDAYTTPEAHKKETLALNLMEQGKGAFKKPVLSVKAVESHIKQMRENAALTGDNTLNSGQAQGLKHILTSRDQFIAIQGYAGTGKTFMWKEANELAISAKQKVFGFAPTGSAAEKLFQDSGIKSQTIDSFIFQNKAVLEGKGKLNAKNQIWTIDEAGLANARHIIDMMILARKSGARVVFQGDGAQLSAIEWGKLFKLMQQHGMATSVLDDIMRQRDPEVREAVYSVLDKDYNRAMAALGERVSVHPGRSENDPLIRVRPLIADWSKLDKESRDSALIVIPDLQTKHLATEKLRESLQAKGELGENVYRASVLRDARLSDPQKGDGRFYKSGMVVDFNKDFAAFKIAKGTRFNVVESQGLDKVLLRSEDGKLITWNPQQGGGSRMALDVYNPEHSELAAGDRIKWTKTQKALGLRNADTGVVKSFDLEKKTALVEFTRGSKTFTKVLDLTKDRNFEHDYIKTAFISQGLDSKHVFTVAESFRRNLVNEKSFYVKLSRTKDKIRIYTDDADKLRKAISRTGEKTSAIESQRGARARAKEKSQELPWIKKLMKTVADRYNGKGKESEQPQPGHEQNKPAERQIEKTAERQSDKQAEKAPDKSRGIER